MSETFTINSIHLGEDIILLHTPAILEYFREGVYLIGYCKSLEISVLGETLEELIEDFQDELEIVWDQYAEEGDHLLTASALKLKQVLLNMAGK